jgi:hypothetical protein
MAHFTSPVCATSDLDQKFGISKSTRTKRLNQLGFTSETLHKDGTKYWLTSEQLDIFAEFDSYIAKNGSDRGYPFPNDVEDDSRESNSAYESIIRSESCAGDDPTIDPNETDEEETRDPNGELALVDDSSTDLFSSDVVDLLDPIYLSAANSSNLLVQRITRNAKQRAAAIVMAEHTLANQYIANPDALDPELRAQINSIDIPKIDPKEFAARLISGANRII